MDVGLRLMIQAEFDGLGDATEVGLFSRGKGTTRYQNFIASGRLRLAAFEGVSEGVLDRVAKWFRR